MSPKSLLRDLQSKIETDASAGLSDTVITEIRDDNEESKAIVMQEVEGRLRMIEVRARVIGDLPHLW